MMWIEVGSRTSDECKQGQKKGIEKTMNDMFDVFFTGDDSVEMLKNVTPDSVSNDNSESFVLTVSVTISRVLR